MVAAPEARSEPLALATAAEVLFGTEDNPLILRDGRKLVVERGKVKHVGLLLDFFNALIANMEKDDIVALVTLIEERSTRDIAAGAAPEAKTVDQLVTQAFQRSSLIVVLFQTTYTVLPRIVSALTKMTDEEFQSLDMDEGLAVAVTVFQVNYSFFSQNLPHAIRVFLALAARKLGSK